MAYLSFFVNETATTKIYTLSLHDALPIEGTANLARRFLPAAARVVDIPWDISVGGDLRFPDVVGARTAKGRAVNAYPDRKSTRLNSRHANILYAGFCLKKKYPCRMGGSIF